MAGELDPSTILEALSGLQGGGKQAQAEFRTLPSEEQNLFVFARLLRILSGVKNVSWYAANDLDGLNHNVEGRSLYVSNFMNAIRVLAGSIGAAKQDVDLPELEKSLGVTSPEDELAIRHVKIPFEWQQEPGEEIIKAEVGIWDILSVWLDVNVMHRFEGFVAGRPDIVREVLNEYYSDSDPKKAANVERDFRRITEGGDVVFARDAAFDALVMRRALKYAIGVGEHDEFPGLPEYTSLLTPVGFPIENLSYIEGISNPEGTQSSYLWDALGPLLFAAEGFAGVTGDTHNLRQDIGPWIAMQSLRSFMTMETYEIDTYNTTSYLATDAFNMSITYDALLHRMAEEGVAIEARAIELRDAASGERRKLSAEEREAIKEIITIELPFDPRALDYMISQVPIEDMERYLYETRKMAPRDPASSTERRARPFGTWGRVAEAHFANHPERRNLFDRVDFLPWMEKVGIKGKRLAEIKHRGARKGGYIGQQGLATLLNEAGIRIMTMPTKARTFRNWFHYAKSVDATLNGNIKPAFELLFQANLSDAGLQKAAGNRPLHGGRLGYDKRRAIGTVLALERDAARLVTGAMGQMSDPKNTAAFRFREAPEMKAYIIQQSLLVAMQAHLVYLTGNVDWMNTPEMDRLRESVPSAGYLVEPDWDDFVASVGQQMRPRRITRRDLEKIASQLGESFDQREKALLDRGYYWMPWKSKVKEREGQTVNSPEDVLHHPMRKPARRLVTVQEYLHGLRQAVDRLETNARAHANHRGRNIPHDISDRIARFRSVLDQPRFSPVHLQGLYAYPGELWRDGLKVFESTTSGTPFLQAGSLGDVRAIIDLYESSGLLPERYTTIRRYDLDKNEIEPEALKQGRQDVEGQLVRLEPGVHFQPSPLVEMAPDHLLVKRYQRE